MKYNFFLVFFFLSGFIVCGGKEKNELVVYFEYCQGCIIWNFFRLKVDYVVDWFEVYIDIIDVFLLKNVKDN